jgi:hypothetical protein
MNLGSAQPLSGARSDPRTVAEARERVTDSPAAREVERKLLRQLFDDEIV